MRELILLVNSDASTLHRLEKRLCNEGYLVAAASRFDDAKMLLNAVSPDLLIVDVRLHAYNGLHLAARSRLQRPSLRVIITHTTDDPVLQSEATRQSAVFVVDPLENPRFLDVVRTTLQAHRAGVSMVRRWPRKRAGMPLSAQAAGTSARILDLSYGGLKLELTGEEQELPSGFEVAVPQAGLTLPASRVWIGRCDERSSWCGVELADTEGPGTVNWRAFVDAAD